MHLNRSDHSPVESVTKFYQYISLKNQNNVKVHTEKHTLEIKEQNEVYNLHPVKEVVNRLLNAASGSKKNGDLHPNMYWKVPYDVIRVGRKNCAA